MPESKNLKLYLSNADDTSTLVVDWIQKVAGNNTDSNMAKIDSEIGEIQDDINAQAEDIESLQETVLKKQDKLIGKEGQFVGFDKDGNPEAQVVDFQHSLPIATPSVLGGVRPVSKTRDMTQPVGVDTTGGLWYAPLLSDNPSSGTGNIVIIDDTLTKEGAAADAKAVGDEFERIGLMCIPGGGKTNQILVKKSEANYDTEWRDAPEGGSTDGGSATDVLVDAIDFSDWNRNSFAVTVGGQKYYGGVTKDDNDRPTSITINGHTMTITFPEVE